MHRLESQGLQSGAEALKHLKGNTFGNLTEIDLVSLEAHQ